MKTTVCLYQLPAADPVQDSRGLSAEYLRNEAGKSFFIGMAFLLLAANSSAGVVLLALDSSYLPAIVLAVVASMFWRNAISESRRSVKLHIAANLESNG